MSWKEIIQNKWVRLGFWSVLYVAWVIWLGNYWWLLGLAIIFDLIVTKKVKWLFWKKEYAPGEKHNFWLDWLDAIIFAVVVVTFINIFFFPPCIRETISSYPSSPTDRVSPRHPSPFPSRTTGRSEKSPIPPLSRTSTAG